MVGTKGHGPLSTTRGLDCRAGVLPQRSARTEALTDFHTPTTDPWVT